MTGPRPKARAGTRAKPKPKAGSVARASRLSHATAAAREQVATERDELSLDLDPLHDLIADEPEGLEAEDYGVDDDDPGSPWDFADVDPSAGAARHVDLTFSRTRRGLVCQAFTPPPTGSAELDDNRLQRWEWLRHIGRTVAERQENAIVASGRTAAYWELLPLTGRDLAALATGAADGAKLSRSRQILVRTLWGVAPLEFFTWRTFPPRKGPPPEGPSPDPLDKVAVTLWDQVFRQGRNDTAVKHRIAEDHRVGYESVEKLAPVLTAVHENWSTIASVAAAWPASALLDPRVVVGRKRSETVYRLLAVGALAPPEGCLPVVSTARAFRTARR